MKVIQQVVYICHFCTLPLSTQHCRIAFHFSILLQFCAYYNRERQRRRVMLIIYLK